MSVQGAPLVPVYHAMLAHAHTRPVAVLNVGGVANVTYIGASDMDLVAFDTGPGNALIDDWVRQHGCGHFDDRGRIAARGTVKQDVIDRVIASSPFFQRRPPKSLDRSDFSAACVEVCTWFSIGVRLS